MREYSETITSKVRDYLNKEEYHFLEDDGIFRMSMNLKGRVGSTNVLIEVRRNDFMVFARCPLDADPDKPEELQELSTFFCDVNYKLLSGKFEVDLTDGQLEYMVFTDCEGLEDGPTMAMVENSIGVAAGMLQRYGNGILGILFSGLTASQAMELCSRGK
ncbi:MAG: hypothetical protein IIZ39_05475 [Blautia sp.]|nr:hypothetical protein [Blautia sp.]